MRCINVEEARWHSLECLAENSVLLEGIFAKEDFTKAQVVEALREFLPNFQHEEIGKNLDQKM